MEVAPGIHRIETRIGERINALHLFVGRDAILLVDTGLADVPQTILLPYLAGIGVEPRQVTYVLTSHADFDHMGGNAALRALAPQARFLGHARDRAQIEDIERMITERYGEFRAAHGIDDSEEAKAFIRASAQGTPLDVILQGGERLRLSPDWEVEILHTPGHSHGHLSVYDARSQALLIADAALGHGLVTHDGRPAFPPTYRYVDAYEATIQRFQSLPIALLLTSHYPVYDAAAGASFLADSRSYVARVEASVRQTLQHATAGMTTRQLIDALAPQLGEWSETTFLVHPLTGHLERLAQYGLVDLTYRPGASLWRWQ